MKSISQLLTAAIIHQQAGRLQDAEALYREILARDKRQPDAWHLLGTIAQQIGDSAAAIDLIGHAIELDPRNASFHCNLGNAQVATGLLVAAEASYRQALQRKRDFPLAQFNLAALLKQLGRTDEALALYEQILQSQPEFVEAHYNLAVIKQEQCLWVDASAGYQRTLQLRPNHADAWNNLGLVLKEQGSLAEAAECHRRAIQFRPDYAEAFNNLGVAHRELRETHRAIECYTQALQLKPDYAVAFNNLGNALLVLGCPQDAVTFLKRAIELQPGFAEAYTNLGAALQDLKQWNDAAECLRVSLQLKPDDAGTLQSLGDVVRDSGDTDSAIDCYRKSLELKPDCPSALGQLIHQLQHQCAWDEIPALTDRAIRLVAQAAISMEPSDPIRTSRETSHPGNSPMSPFAYLTMPVATSSEQQQQCASRWAAECLRTVVRQTPPQPVVTSADSRIRVGYLSADFRAHPVAELIVELFESHDRSRFHVTGYSYGPDDGSAIRRRIASAFETFVDQRDQSLADSIQRIAADGIEILVDLTGFTQHARTQILAARPAPIQVNYLGYPGTMGADFVDYILVDDFIVPADRQPFYNERLVHLPGCYQVNDSQRVISEPTPTRAEVGLPAEGLVFCSFNSNYKITSTVFDVWMCLLRATPASVLWLLESNRQAPINLRRAAEERGIDPKRLVFAPRRPLPDHLARHRLADLFLDTFPVNAHTTASDALWAGCPVLTLSGETFVSRVAGSLLCSLDLRELITFTLDEYRTRALQLAARPEELAALRQRLSENRRTSSVFDVRQSARSIEQAYETMHAIWCSGASPRPFSVPAAGRIRPGANHV
ncbi:MAG: tetratricopeptide repeat protein [Planctomycetes bacterium]|nr:tetratricopeptide repeat protein [Planctomycetota bacterium]